MVFDQRASLFLSLSSLNGFRGSDVGEIVNGERRHNWVVDVFALLKKVVL